MQCSQGNSYVCWYPCVLRKHVSYFILVGVSGSEKLRTSTSEVRGGGGSLNFTARGAGCGAANVAAVASACRRSTGKPYITHHTHVSLTVPVPQQLVLQQSQGGCARSQSRQHESMNACFGLGSSKPEGLRGSCDLVNQG